jgi:hypothetical protein
MTVETLEMRSAGKADDPAQARADVGNVLTSLPEGLRPPTSRPNR